MVTYTMLFPQFVLSSSLLRFLGVVHYFLQVFSLIGLFFEISPMDGSLSDAYSFATHWLGVYFVTPAFFSPLVHFLSATPNWVYLSTC